MPDEVVQWLGEIDPRVIIDGTYGGGGHARRLLELLPKGEGLLIALDRDPAVTQRVESETNDPRLNVFLGSYEQAAKAMAVCGVDQGAVDVWVGGRPSERDADCRGDAGFVTLCQPRSVGGGYERVAIHREGI